MRVALEMKSSLKMKTHKKQWTMAQLYLVDGVLGIYTLLQWS